MAYGKYGMMDYSPDDLQNEVEHEEVCTFCELPVSEDDKTIFEGEAWHKKCITECKSSEIDSFSKEKLKDMLMSYMLDYAENVGEIEQAEFFSHVSATISE